MKTIFKVCVGIILILQASVYGLFDPKLIVPNTSKTVQREAVEDLIKRTVGAEASQHFKVIINNGLPIRSYKITGLGETGVLITGWDGVSVAKGFHYYLKYVLNKDISWTNTRLELPATVPALKEVIESTSASSIIYYQNVCTWSYSFAWWTWSTWRQHIDWMAMMGINLAIAPVQEEIWFHVYTKMGLKPAEINEHFAGPAFQAWQRMGNIRGWGGPLTPAYRRMQLQLQKRILHAQRVLGISVALPSFAGHVPTAMKRLYPNATLTPVPRWNNFADRDCCTLFVEPNQTLFYDIATEFLNAVVINYGSDHIFFCDPFNELEPRLAEATYLNATAKHIYEAMHSVDPNGIWLLQGWMFVKNPFWTDQLIEAFLTAVPLGKLLVLDLQSEQFPQYERTHSYHGQPYVWCMLHNFGGTLGMFGSAALVNERIGKARRLPNSTMVGVGMTPEGIHQNYVIYSLLLERAWQQEDLDLGTWFGKFASVRYGSNDLQLQRAWQLLQKTVYSYCGLRRMRGKYTITRRPATNMSPWIWYNASDVQEAWSLFLQANVSNSAKSEQDHFKLDLVDVTRQNLQILADRLYVNLMSSYRKQSTERFKYIANLLLSLFDDLEDILATHNNFLLGPWLESAKHLARNEAERELYEINARNQITAWGPHGQILDYANKQWSGLMQDYYKPRWVLFLTMMQQSLEHNTRFNNTAYKHKVSEEIENAFSTQTKNYPRKSKGEPFDVAQRINKRWTDLQSEQTFVHYVRLRVKQV